jgi:NAD(P)-dependent dehydrogenase (short-subunit alcohol dehydrogenase family)
MQGKVCAVTGAGSGIGRATAVGLAELGTQGSDINEAGLDETKAQCMPQTRPGAAFKAYCVNAAPIKRKPC